MTFMPRITAETRALEARRPLTWRRWHGVIADVWHVRGAAGAGGHYISPYPRLVIFLAPGASHMRLRCGRMKTWHDGVGAFFVPGGIPLWSELSHAQEFSHLDLHLDSEPFMQRLQAHALSSAIDTPAFVPAHADGHQRVQALAKILAEEVEMPTRPDAMLDALVTALLTEVLDLGIVQQRTTERGGLPPHTVRQIERHVSQQLHRRITVAELAQLAGLSESWFARAFKQSLAMTPRRWLLQQRIATATTLLDEGALGLAEIAAAAGFADQAHLTRCFRAVHDQPPGAWRRNSLRPNHSKHGSLVQSEPKFPI